MISKDYVSGAISCYRTKNGTLWVAVFGMVKDDELKSLIANPNRVVEK